MLGMATSARGVCLCHLIAERQIAWVEHRAEERISFAVILRVDHGPVLRAQTLLAEGEDLSLLERDVRSVQRDVLEGGLLHFCARQHAVVEDGLQLGAVGLSRRAVCSFARKRVPASAIR